MNAAEIIKELNSLGSDSYKRTLLNHGVREPVYGVKIEDMKRIVKRVKKDYRLALELYDTGVYDAMYLAGLIADDQRMTKTNLRDWLKKARSLALAQFTVAWVAAESNHGRELALQWIDSDDENVATAGWSTLAGLVAIKDDAELDLTEVKRLMRRAASTIHTQPNRVRYVMNSFLIAAGSYIASLTEYALELAASIGVVTVDMGNTACKVPSAYVYIKKVQKRGAIGKKRKTVKC